MLRTFDLKSEVEAIGTDALSPMKPITEKKVESFEYDEYFDVTETSICLKDNEDYVLDIIREISAMDISDDSSKSTPTFQNVLDIVNKITVCLSHKEEEVVDAAIKLNDLENELEKRLSLRSDVKESLKKHDAEQTQLESKLSKIELKQRELEQSADSFEKFLMNDNCNSDSFIHNFYDQADVINSKLQRMSEDLNSISENVNAKFKNSSKDEMKSMVNSTIEMLNVFQNVLQFFETAITELENNVY